MCAKGGIKLNGSLGNGSLGFFPSAKKDLLFFYFPLSVFFHSGQQHVSPIQLRRKGKKKRAVAEATSFLL